MFDTPKISELNPIIFQDTEYNYVAVFTTTELAILFASGRNKISHMFILGSGVA
jgi:hypothetical protein